MLFDFWFSTVVNGIRVCTLMIYRFHSGRPQRCNFYHCQLEVPICIIPSGNQFCLIILFTHFPPVFPTNTIKAKQTLYGIKFNNRLTSSKWNPRSRTSPNPEGKKLKTSCRNVDIHSSLKILKVATSNVRILLFEKSRAKIILAVLQKPKLIRTVLFIRRRTFSKDKRIKSYT